MGDDLGGLSEEARAAIGRTSEHTYEVTAKDIRRYAQAIGDPNPVYRDEAAAANSRWGGIVAPPLFCHSLAFEDVPVDRLHADGRPAELDVPLPTDRSFGAGSSFTVGVPVRPGDTITVRNTIVDIYRKSGRSGELIFVVLDTTYTNQFGDMVAHERGTSVNR
jgi:acyl dehydratase